EVLRVLAQEAADERRPREQAPLLVLQRAQVLRAYLRGLLDLGDVDLGAHARLAQGGSDLRHRDAGYRGTTRRFRRPREADRRPVRTPAAEARPWRLPSPPVSPTGRRGCAARLPR